MSKKTVTVLLLLVGFASISGWAQTGSPSQPGLTLTLERAVKLALSPDGDPRVRLAEEGIRQAEARSAQSRALLLPDFEGSLSVVDKTIALGTIGLTQVPTLSIPHLVGPFTHSDARASFRQNVLDLSSYRQLEASHAEVAASKAGSKGTRDQVTAQVARLYMAALRADATLETSKADLALAQALLEQASNRLAAGTGIEIDETRAQVQLAQEQQRLLAAEIERKRARLELLKILNLKLDTDLELTGTLALIPVGVTEPEQALAVASKSRADLEAQQRREEAARWNDRAVKMERVPSIQVFGDYGSSTIGTTISVPTRSVGVLIQVPIFDGGGREARRAESRSLERQENLRGKDLRKAVEVQVRRAMDDLRSAEQQAKASEKAVSLAEKELAQAHRRYDGGVASGIEVTDAQTHLAQARESYIQALYQYNLARIDLGEATGTIQSMIEEPMP